jgi:hypothetical protein
VLVTLRTGRVVPGTAQNVAAERLNSSILTSECSRVDKPTTDGMTATDISITVIPGERPNCHSKLQLSCSILNTLADYFSDPDGLGWLAEPIRLR